MFKGFYYMLYLTNVVHGEGENLQNTGLSLFVFPKHLIFEHYTSEFSEYLGRETKQH